MRLTEVRNHIRAEGCVSLLGLARHLNTDPETVRPMVDHWVRKGRVTAEAPSCALKSGKSSACAGCSSAGATELYRWLG